MGSFRAFPRCQVGFVSQKWLVVVTHFCLWRLQSRRLPFRQPLMLPRRARMPLSHHSPTSTPHARRSRPVFPPELGQEADFQVLQINVDHVESAGDDEVTGPEETVVTLEAAQPRVRELVPSLYLSPSRPGSNASRAGASAWSASAIACSADRISWSRVLSWWMIELRFSRARSTSLGASLARGNSANRRARSELALVSRPKPRCLYCSQGRTVHHHLDQRGWFQLVNDSPFRASAMKRGDEGQAGEEHPRHVEIFIGHVDGVLTHELDHLECVARKPHLVAFEPDAHQVCPADRSTTHSRGWSVRAEAAAGRGDEGERRSLRTAARSVFPQQSAC